MENISIALFHYHFLPGGVTTVAVHAVNALMEHSSSLSFSIGEIVFVSGRADNLENIVSSQINIPEGADIKISYRVSPSIGYITDEQTAGQYARKNEIEKLFREFSGYVWWVHNYHLGKNPLFTRILVQKLTANPLQKALLHIHDFPECARPDNYRFLTSKTGTLYPAGSNISYIAINARDQRYLKEAGIPDRQVFLLYDPVPGLERNGQEEQDGKQEHADKGVMEYEKARKARNSLAENFRKFFPSFTPEKPIALYPVRSIRRKNILEAGVLASVTGDGFNLLVTLPGISRQETGYSETVRKCFENSLIPGIWGCGSGFYGVAEDFSNVISASDFLISASLIEGFGYFFIDSLRWGKPLVSRYLEISDSFSDIFKNSAAFFYDNIKVPLENSKKEETVNLYRTALSRYSGIVAPDSIDEITGQIESILRHESVDFSYLPVNFQVEVLENIKTDSSYRNTVKTINKETISGILETAGLRQKFDRKKAAEYFSFRSFARTFNQILETGANHGSSQGLAEAGGEEGSEKPGSTVSERCSVTENLLAHFFRPEFLRLLLSELQ